MSEYIVDVGDADELHLAAFIRRAEFCFGYPVREEIVRCRDCKHFRIEPWDEALAAQYGAPPMICERTGDMDDVEPDGFCAWGKRRSE